MTLNDADRRQTSDELTSNLTLSGLKMTEVAADLEFTQERLQSALETDYAADPVDVWQLRDYLHQAVLDAGEQPTTYSVLTDRSRILARVWFQLRRAPRHTFARS